MTGRRIAYVMEQTLGNITHYLNLRSHEHVAGHRPLWLPIEYCDGRLPWTIRGGILARKALKPRLADVDAVFIHNATIGLLSADFFSRQPAVLSCDATPMNKRSMRGDYGLKPENARVMGAKRRLYREVFERAAGFVGWSDWAKASFVEDYGCKEGDVASISPGIDLGSFGAGQRDHEIPRILFVGGDFYRKGGETLLSVFEQRLRGKAELVLVTRSPVPERAGVRVLRNLDANSQELRDIYAACDIFALPTRADAFSFVCMEALAAGMPVVTTRVGGIPEIVRNGETGYLVGVDNEDELGDALLCLVNDRAHRERIGKAGRLDAEKRFDVRLTSQRLFEFVSSRC